MKQVWFGLAVAVVLPAAFSISADTQTRTADVSPDPILDSEIRIDVDSLTSVPDSPLATVAVDASSRENREQAKKAVQNFRASSRLAKSSSELKSEGVGVDPNATVQAIAEALPGIYSTFARSASAEFDYEVVFTETPPGWAIDLLSSLSQRVRIRTGDTVTDSQRLEIQSNLLSELDARGFDSSRATIVSSRLGTALGVVVPTSGTDSTASEADLERELAEALGEQAELIDVFVNLEDPATPVNRELMLVRGGHRITGPCTTGFGAIRESNGRLGIVTAKHCPDEPWYETAGIKLLNAIGGPGGRDSQFNGIPSPHTADSSYRADWNVANYVSFASDPAFGDPVNTFGADTGKHQGYVNNVNTCYTHPGGQWCGVFVTTADAGGGDSGGPCYYGVSARGLISGGNGSVTYCTRISQMPGGIRILTNQT